MGTSQKLGTPLGAAMVARKSAVEYQKQDRLSEIYRWKFGRYPQAEELQQFRQKRMFADRAAKNYWRQFVAKDRSYE